MTAPAAPQSGLADRGNRYRMRLLGAAALAALTLLTWLESPWTERLREAWFDSHQAIAPRRVDTLPVTIVEIDQKSLVAIGQWPWPRTEIARLIATINQSAPAAIGIDILMPEADALSPDRVLARAQLREQAVIDALQALPTNDAVLAQALGAAPTVMAFAGTPEPSPSVLRTAPVTVRQLQAGDGSVPDVAQYAGVLTSIGALNGQARGWGLISVDNPRGVVRRMPLVARIDRTLVPAFALEMLRVASGAPTVQVTVSGDSVHHVKVADLAVPSDADGAVRVYFSPRRADRFVSAADVLAGTFDPSLLQGQLVLIGPTAIGLDDFQNTPIGERMPGSEIHAQMIENLLGGSLLVRPKWAPFLEAGVVLILGALLVWITPRWRPWRAAMLALACVALPALGAFVLFRVERLLVDAATPSLSLAALFLLLLLMTLTEATRQRRSLERVVQAQREQAARIAGELEAAQRIQIGSLPRLDLLRDDRRVDLHAVLTPAREVGGDLYDFFRLDDRRLFLLIGDVSGKGLPASIFMAVSKALCKGSMLRAPRADVGDIMTEANAEVSRDNAQMMFVTAFAAILDLDSGELQYCNAGHDNPYRLVPGRTQPLRIVDGDGPPLCALSDFGYVSARCQLQPGETLCLMTDGVSEAQNQSGELYGGARVDQLLSTPTSPNLDPRTLVARLQSDVAAFAGGAEPADDLTIVALRWMGPRATGT